MVFIMQCGNCYRFMIMEEEWCGSDMDCPLCGLPIHLDPVAPSGPCGPISQTGEPAEAKPPPRLQARPSTPRQ